HTPLRHLPPLSPYTTLFRSDGTDVTTHFSLINVVSQLAEVDCEVEETRPKPRRAAARSTLTAPQLQLFDCGNDRTGSGGTTPGATRASCSPHPAASHCGRRGGHCPPRAPRPPA